MATVPCIDDDGVSSVRVLVVEDFVPFRQFIALTLAKRGGRHRSGCHAARASRRSSQ
jgi:hypothetical protein